MQQVLFFWIFGWKCQISQIKYYILIENTLNVTILYVWTGCLPSESCNQDIWLLSKSWCNLQTFEIKDKSTGTGQLSKEKKELSKFFFSTFVKERLESPNQKRRCAPLQILSEYKYFYLSSKTTATHPLQLNMYSK